MLMCVKRSEKKELDFDKIKKPHTKKTTILIRFLAGVTEISLMRHKYSLICTKTRCTHAFRGGY